MDNNSIILNISGIPTEVKISNIDIDKILLDEENPRIGFQKDTNISDSLSQGQIQFALKNKNPEAFEKLKDNIEINEGIINPIWVEKIEEDRYIVIEGNTRLYIYTQLNRKYPHKKCFKKIHCRVLPSEINDEQRAFIKLEAHLRGTTPWDAYEKARYLYNLWNYEGYSFAALASKTKLSEKEIAQSIDAFKDMEEQYLPNYGNDPSEVLKFSYFVEYEKNNKLKLEMEKNNLSISDFCNWIGEDKINRAQDVRELKNLLESGESREAFVNHGFDYAKEILGTIKPDLVDPLYQNIEKVIDDLRNIPNYQIIELQENIQPNKKNLIIKLQKEVNEFVNRYFSE